jgi:cytochrome c biogenesis protein CcdA
MKKNKLLFIGIILSVFILFIPQISAESDFNSATIYYNEACAMCSDYLEDIKELLTRHGINNIEVKDYVNFKEYRKELLAINEKHNIPPSLQGHLVTIVDEQYFFEGHVPLEIIEETLSKDIDDKLLIYQDKMDETPDFKIWAFRGESKTYKTDSSITEYLDWFQENKDSLPEINSKSEYRFGNLMPLIITTGLLAGIHPCTVAVLLFFLAFMFTLQSSRMKIFRIGLAYIIGIFVAFSAIGMGLFKAMIFTTPHLAAKIAGVLVIILGIINIWGFFFKKKINLGIPKVSKDKIVQLVHKASVPAALLLGIFVGICSFGCTAGIYFSILGLIATQAAKGTMYLMVYNLMFVIPLIIILLFTANKKVVDKLQELQRAEVKWVKLIGGILMVLLGIYLLIPM